MNKEMPHLVESIYRENAYGPTLKGVFIGALIGYFIQPFWLFLLLGLAFGLSIYGELAGRR